MNQAAAKLDILALQYPPPIDVRDIEKFSEDAVVLGVTFHLAGFAGEVDGECVTGSAADVREPPTLRAYMELLERLSVLNAMRKAAPLTLRDSCGTRVGLAPASYVLPSSPDSSRWKWARSNGVAIAPTWSEAARRAHLELIERDRVLRSFYGELRPRRLPSRLAKLPRPLSKSFSFCAYSFDGDSPEGGHAAAVFGFPRSRSSRDPLVYGFAARHALEDAVAAAGAECLQRLGFLFGEALPDAPPEPTPSPDFHQEYFLFPDHHEKLRRWLRGEHAAFRGCLEPHAALAPEEPLYADLTPPSLEGRLFVARALPRGHLPLAFGVGHPMLASTAPAEVLVHPIT